MRLNYYNNVGGWRGTQRTVREMKKLVREGKRDPTIVFAASQLARKCHHKDFLCQATKIFGFVKSHIHYVRDPRAVELVRSPFWTLYYRTGDCDDQAILFCALAESIGFKTRFKGIKADPSEPTEFSHIFSQVLVPGHGWLSADTIVQKAKLGWESPSNFGEHVWEEGGMSGMAGAFIPGAVYTPFPAGGERRKGTEWAGFGGRTMRGFGQVAPAPARNIWGKLSDALMPAITNTIGIVGQYGNRELGKALGTGAQQAAAAVAPPPRPKAPMATWLIPLGIAGAAGLGAIALTMRKRRRR